MVSLGFFESGKSPKKRVVCSFFLEQNRPTDTVSSNEFVHRDISHLRPSSDFFERFCRNTGMRPRAVA